MKRIDTVGNTPNEAWCNLVAELARISKTEKIDFHDIRQVGNHEMGYKLIFKYETADNLSGL